MTGAIDRAAPAPRVSVLIPCYGRPDDLRQTLSQIRRQTYPAFEVVIVDDGTPGDAIARVAAAFPECRYLRLPANVGLIGARNIGFAECRGDYIVNLDDDSWPVAADALERIVGYLDANPGVAVLALNVQLAQGGAAWDPALPSFEVGTYTGCGNVHRRAITAKVGGYIAEFIRQGEELEHAMRVVDAGYRVVALPAVVVLHAESPLHRDPVRIRTLEAVNILRREALRAPPILLPLGAALFCRFVLRNGRTIDWALLYRQLVRAPHPLAALIRRHRAPVKVGSYLRWLRLRRAVPGA